MRKLIDELVSVDLLKTWSLIITILGDFSREANTSISGKEIKLILEHIGIKPEATRVALHRLKKDGWIDTAKIGREVFYKLSDEGYSQTSVAYEDVYRDSDKYEDGWKLVLSSGNDLGELNEGSNCIHLFKNVFLLPASSAIKHIQVMELDFDREEIPDWFENRIIQNEILEISKKLDVLAEKIIASDFGINGLDAIVIRILFLHHWRKLALRNNTWAHIWLFKNGSIAGYQRKVFTIFNMLSKAGGKRV